MAVPPTLAIVMPAYQAVREVASSVPAALRALEQGGGGELVVVDPASTDGTGDAAERLGARVVRLPQREGPAHARNTGVAGVDADVVVFVDSDCVAHEDVVERVRAAFAADETLVSLTGSYDEHPPHRGFASLYMNLRHHYTHQHAEREGASFWAGFGAVRREAFLAVGGFDAARFPLPMIEDIELALRLQPLGRTALDPRLQVTHLKRWTIASVIRTDVFSRALPWSKLIVDSGEMRNDLNLRTSQRVAAAVAPLALAGALVLPFVFWALPPIQSLVALASVLLGLALNAGMAAFFARRGGLAFAAFGWLFHQLHLTYSAAVFAYVLLTHRPQGRRA